MPSLWFLSERGEIRNMPKISYIHALFRYQKRRKLWFSRWHIPASATSMKSQRPWLFRRLLQIAGPENCCRPWNLAPLLSKKTPLFSNTQREWTDRNMEEGIRWWFDDIIMQKGLRRNISTTEQIEASAVGSDEVCASGQRLQIRTIFTIRFRKNRCTLFCSLFYPIVCENTMEIIFPR